MDQPPSQASSHFPLEPIPASILADREVQRRNALIARGNFMTGCAELDDYVLLGGFERGCVVGLSAEDEEMGVQLALQTLTHCLSNSAIRKAMIITPKPPNTILGGLRSGIKAELQAQGVSAEELGARTRSCLDSVLLSCVFDLDGLWEVLADLDKPASPEEEDGVRDGAVRDEVKMADEGKPVEEIQDSQDEPLSPLSQDNESPPPAHPQPNPTSALPELIIITHFSSLLTSLFTHREKSAAHDTLQLLASHLRHLTRHLPTSPLILILNSTTTTTDTSTPAQKTAPDDTAPKSLDQTLRSIFNPPPLAGYAHTASSRRNKPSFGLVFSQLLDVHLLCTRIPRTKGDAEAAVTSGPVRLVWVVECLLDEMGVWNGEVGVRKSREQRWTAVDVEGRRIRDAFEGEENRGNTGEVRVAGGFGGRRV
ncbi:Fc.00g042360.m01.CDS01 [Cosmosporella sp. VM-42]